MITDQDIDVLKICRISSKETCLFGMYKYKNKIHMKRTKTNLTVNWILLLVGSVMFVTESNMMSGMYFNLAMTLVVVSVIIESIALANLYEMNVRKDLLRVRDKIKSLL